MICYSLIVTYFHALHTGTPGDFWFKKTPTNLTPFSEMGGSCNLFSPSALGLTPAKEGGIAPRIFDDIMLRSSIFPTPTKPTVSPRLDLNKELSERMVKQSSRNNHKSDVKFACSDSPEWNVVSLRSHVLIMLEFLMYLFHKINKLSLAFNYQCTVFIDRSCDTIHSINACISCGIKC